MINIVRVHDGKSLFATLKSVLRYRCTRPTAKELIKGANKILSSHGSNCRRKYEKTLRFYDDCLFQGELFKSMQFYNFNLVVRCCSEYKNLDHVYTTLDHFNRTFYLTLSLPNSVRRTRAHVGGIPCRFMEDCTAQLLAHEFVHILELFLRSISKFSHDFSSTDKNNVLFMRWLKILFGHHTDAHLV